jgi:hypothetical protein
MLLFLDIFFKLFDHLPDIKGKRNPLLAFFLGGLFGCLGLSIYFGTVSDFFVPLAIMILFIVPAVTTVLIPLVVGVYGYFRASHSNKKQ